MLRKSVTAACRDLQSAWFVRQRGWVRGLLTSPCRSSTSPGAPKGQRRSSRRHRPAAERFRSFPLRASKASSLRRLILQAGRRAACRPVGKMLAASPAQRQWSCRLALAPSGQDHQTASLDPRINNAPSESRKGRVFRGSPAEGAIGFQWATQSARCPITASVYCWRVALPPRSGVWFFGSAMALRMAF